MRGTCLQSLARKTLARLTVEASTSDRVDSIQKLLTADPRYSLAYLIEVRPEFREILMLDSTLREGFLRQANLIAQAEATSSPDEPFSFDEQLCWKVLLSDSAIWAEYREAADDAAKAIEQRFLREDSLTFNLQPPTGQSFDPEEDTVEFEPE